MSQRLFQVHSPEKAEVRETAQPVRRGTVVSALAVRCHGSGRGLLQTETARLRAPTQRLNVKFRLRAPNHLERTQRQEGYG